MVPVRARTSLFPSVFELYKFYRSELDFEYSRINDRMNWLLVSHAFLFTVLAALLACDEGKSKHVLFLYVIVSFLGMFSAGCVSIGIIGAKTRVSDIKDRGKIIYKLLSFSGVSSEGVCINMIPCALPKAHKLGGIPSVVLPSLLTGVWGFISIRELYSVNYNDKFLVSFGYVCVLSFWIICLLCFSCGVSSAVLKRKCKLYSDDENNKVVDSDKIYVRILFGLIICCAIGFVFLDSETILYTRIAMAISFVFVGLSILFQMRIVWHSS